MQVRLFVFFDCLQSLVVCLQPSILFYQLQLGAIQHPAGSFKDVVEYFGVYIFTIWKVLNHTLTHAYAKASHTGHTYTNILYPHHARTRTLTHIHIQTHTQTHTHTHTHTHSLSLSLSRLAGNVTR